MLRDVPSLYLPKNPRWCSWWRYWVNTISNQNLSLPKVIILTVDHISEACYSSYQESQTSAFQGYSGAIQCALYQLSSEWMCPLGRPVHVEMGCCSHYWTDIDLIHPCRRQSSEMQWSFFTTEGTRIANVSGAAISPSWDFLPKILQGSLGEDGAE